MSDFEYFYDLAMSDDENPSNAGCLIILGIALIAFSGLLIWLVTLLIKIL